MSSDLSPLRLADESVAGVHPTVIAKLIGHADGGALLMRCYRHFFPSETGRAAAAFDQHVRSGREAATAAGDE